MRAGCASLSFQPSHPIVPPGHCQGSGLGASCFVGIKDKASCVNLRFSFHHNLQPPIPTPTPATPGKRDRPGRRKDLREALGLLASVAGLFPGFMCLPSALTVGFVLPALGRARGWENCSLSRRSGLRSLSPWKWEPSLHFGADNGINEMGWVCDCSMNEAMIVLGPDFQNHIHNREWTCHFREQSL